MNSATVRLFSTSTLYDCIVEIEGGGNTQDDVGVAFASAFEFAVAKSRLRAHMDRLMTIAPGPGVDRQPAGHLQVRALAAGPLKLRECDCVL